MSPLRVLIVGASIAGPTAAYFFARAGATVTVIERFPALRTSGQAIDIRTCGVTVMRKIPGMEVAVRSKATTIEGLSIVREDGRPYGVLKATGDPDQQSLLSEFEIFRGELSEILVGLTRGDERVRYVFGEQIGSVRYAGDGKDGPVTVEFVNGMASAEYDLIVACDGATSRTRAIGFGCGVRDHITPTGCWGAYFSIGQDLLQGAKNGMLHSAIGGRAMALGPDRKGTTQCALMKLGANGSSEDTLPFREAQKQGDEALKSFVAGQYRGAGWRSEEMIRGMMDTTDFYASEAVMVRVPQLFKGPFALVGDAGYAPGFTGTGTSLALAGAYVLAGEISKHPGNLPAGLRGYEEIMRPIVRDQSKVPPFVSTFMAPQGPWGIWLRNMVFAFVAWASDFGVISKLSGMFGAAFASSSEYKLPEYEWVR